MFCLPMQETDVNMSKFRSLLYHCEKLLKQQQQQQPKFSKVSSFSPKIATRDPVLIMAANTSRTGELASDSSLNNPILEAPSGISPLPSTSHSEEPQQVNKVTHRGTHMSTHTGEKTYLCETCHTNFTTSRNLDRHMKIHGTQEHVCKKPGCGKKIHK
ncbi:zinc finger protein 614-like [Cryptotermes secundus]|uniref:zinc finger protein 614-like n=1 Tax=Cryptotermes secundus TaxID=105785 RepID=UPI001454D3D8|nr:zinc finger protein 614-like [Cryptotermes secundus]